MKLFLVISLSLVLAQCSQLGIRVVKHQPCHSEKKSQSIYFPSSETAPVQQDIREDEICYKVGGKVQVKKEIRGTLNVYVETKNGTRSEPVDCKNEDQNNCGGIGSCIYCDACSTLTSSNVARKNNVELLIDGKPVDCKNGLKVGNYDNVNIHFCPPNLDDFLRSQNINRKAWDEVIGVQGTSIYMTVHIFDRQINNLSKAQLQNLVNSGDGEIGCHKLLVNVFDTKNGPKK